MLGSFPNYVSEQILVNLYYALIWGNTYSSTPQHLYILQKKAIRIITFSKHNEHSSPLFKRLNIMKLPDLVSFHPVKFMYKFHNNLLLVAFDQFYIPVHGAFNYSTRLAVKQSYYLPKTRTSYGIFNIGFQVLKYGVLEFRGKCQISLFLAIQKENKN